MFKVWKEMSLFVLIICIAITVYNIDREIENFIITKQGIETIGIVSKKVRESENHPFYLMVQFQDINRVKQKAKIYVDRPTYKQIKKNKPIAIKYKQNLPSRIVAFKYPSYWQNNINVYGKISVLAGFGAFLFNKLENVGERKLKAKLDRAKNKNHQKLDLSGIALFSKLTEIPVEIFDFKHLKFLHLRGHIIEYIPESIGNLTNLTNLNLSNNCLTNLPESIGNLSELKHLNLSQNKLSNIPKSIGNLNNLIQLNLSHNNLTNIPEYFNNFANLKLLDLRGNNFNGIPESLNHTASLIRLNGVIIPKKYQGIPLANWSASWLVEIDNAELRRLLIQVVGYEKICQELEAIELDRWREYTLLKIDKEIDIERVYLLKMTCPSTDYIHVLRVPPSYTGSAREAIKWVNHGIDPEQFTIET